MDFFDNIENFDENINSDKNVNSDKKVDVRSLRPLADRMRPSDFSEFVGQELLLGEDSLLRRMISGDLLCSMILWGPSGSGKTTLANIIANKTKFSFHTISAVTSGMKDIKHIIGQARLNLRSYNRKTILFIDEIHRFNKIQQDAFLPYVENGTVILIGATTENPSFSVIGPLLSRCRVFVLKSLSEKQLITILERALEDTSYGLGSFKIKCDNDTLQLIISLSDGDARRALNLLEFCADAVKTKECVITSDIVKALAQRTHLLYDKQGEEHFNIISALHKSLRGSDPDASLYWLCRIIASGEDPLYAARRMIRFASEDIGNADPQALIVALSAREAYCNLGSPEGELALAQAAIYLATAPKSNSVYTAYSAVMKEIKKSGALPVPMHIRNAPTGLMKDLGYGADYQYDHDSDEHFIPQDYLPDTIKSKKFYTPGGFGFEREIKKRLDWWENLKKESKKNENGI
jgi:putative ATPase